MASMVSDRSRISPFGPWPSARSRLGLGLVALVFTFLLVVTALAALDAVRQMVRSASDVEEAYVVLMTLDDIAMGVDQEVSATRGFLLSEAPEFLASQRTARERVWRAVAALEGQYTGDRDRLEGLRALRALVEDRFELSDRYTRIRRENDIASATAQILPGGESLAGRVRAAISMLAGAERAMLAERRGRVSRRKSAST